MKYLILHDKYARVSSLERLLKTVQENAPDLDIKWELQAEDFSRVPWEEYRPDRSGISRLWLRNRAHEIFNEQGYGIDAIVCYPTKANWREPKTKGWGMDGYYGNYGVMQIRELDENTFEHETDHLADTFDPNIAPMGLVWDKDIVHGRSPSYGTYRKDLGKFYYKTKEGDYSYTLQKIRDLHHKDFAAAIDKRKRLSEKNKATQLIRALLIEIITRLLTKERIRDLSDASIEPPLRDWDKLPRGYKFGEKTFYSNFHLGLDVVVPIGTPIYAPCNGKAEKFIGDKGGNTIWFRPDHNTDFIRFLHLNKFGKLGQVYKGDIIGYSGNTGNSTGPHVHIDISKKQLDLGDTRNFINPENYFKGR